MRNNNHIWEDARSIAGDALFEAREPTWEPRLEMATESVAEILLQCRWRTKSLQDYQRWRSCVTRAAMEMVRAGIRPGGAELERRAERQFHR